MTTFQPIIFGHGLSGQAIERALAVIQSWPTSAWKFSGTRYAERGASVAATIEHVENPLIFIANPHALHTDLILQCNELKIPLVFCEKPAATTRSDREKLTTVQTEVAVFHGYRMMWGPQTLKRLLQDQSFGEIIGIECRYWQSSAAIQAYELSLSNSRHPRDIWKNKPELSGPGDVLLDLATHWMDLIVFLAGANPKRASGFRSYVNAEAPHRDTHLQINLAFPNGSYGCGSISKTVHGAGNDLEISILGSKISASWNFLNADQITVGQNRDKTTLSRAASEIGSRQPCFHGLGWLEGYIETIRCGLLSLNNSNAISFPNLKSSLECFDSLQSISWN